MKSPIHPARLSIHFAALIAVTLIWMSALVFNAHAGNRLALVIGNSNYLHTSPLRNPANDADLIGAKLNEIGFEVLMSKNVTLSNAQQLINSFAKKIKAIGDDGIVLFYYAGHGIQLNGDNYIVPVDADLQSETDIILQGINTSIILKIIELSGAKTNVIVLDACRNNPFPAVSRSVAKGLAQMESPSGSFIAYSTSPGEVALDGTGKNSPYTEALAEFITDPSLTLEAVFKKVRRKVYFQTDEAQTTWESTSLIDEVYLVDRGGDAKAAPEKARPASVVKEENFWNQIKDKGDVQLFNTYLQMFPEGAHREIALAQLPRNQDVTKYTQPVTPKFNFTDEELEEKFAKFNKILSILTDGSTQRAIMSYDRYRSWCCKNIAKGPTGKERYIVYGLYEIYPLNWDQYKIWAKLDANTVALMEKHNSDTQVYWTTKYESLPLQNPAFPKLDNAVAALINAFLELHPINNKTQKYYTNKLYEYDKAKGGRKLHAQLYPAFEKFIAAHRNLASLVLAELDVNMAPMIDYAALKNGKSWQWYGARDRYFTMKFALEFLRNRDLDRKQLKDALDQYTANFLEITDFSADAPPPPPDYAGLVSSAKDKIDGMKSVIKEKGKRDWSMHMDISDWF